MCNTPWDCGSILDEISEFKISIIQSLMQPMEERRVSLNRATVSTWYPANFRLVATANPCPWGDLGKEDGICMCSEKEIRRYWKKWVVQLCTESTTESLLPIYELK